MKYLKLTESINYLDKLDITPYPRDVMESLKQNNGFIFLDDRLGKFYYLANIVEKWLRPFESVLFLVCEYGIWPSRENVYLTSRVRMSYGDKRSISEAPGCLFEKQETEDLVLHLHLALLNCWGGCVASEKKVFYFSHDDWAGFSGPYGDKIADEWRNSILKLDNS